MDSSELLRRTSTGDKEAEADLYVACYTQLRARAGQLMRNQGCNHTLQPTILVNEAWMKLAFTKKDWESRGHFLRVATRAMRSVLIDHARAKLANKRGGGAARQELLQDPAGANEPSWRMLALDEALTRLEDEHPMQHQVAQLRIFGGLPHREIAEALGLTERTIERHWASAREALKESL